MNPKKFNLSNKLTLIVTSAIIIIMSIVGVYFDSILKTIFLNQNKQLLVYSFHHLANNLTNIENELRDISLFPSTDDELIASIDLINKHKKLEKYDGVLIDLEKKKITTKLLDLVKLSLNSSAAIYDKNEQLIAYVTKIEDHYFLGFTSYDNNQLILYGKFENGYEYKLTNTLSNNLIQLRHKSYYDGIENNSTPLITYHKNINSLTIQSHMTFFVSKSDQISAHLEISKQLEPNDFIHLSDELGLSLKLSSAEQNKAINLKQNNLIDVVIHPTKNKYLAYSFIPTDTSPFYISFFIEKYKINALLSNNRPKLILLLILLTIIILVITRLFITRYLTLPLSQLMSQIEHTKDQQYEHENIVKTGDEIEIISKNINTLSCEINSHENSLKKSQLELKHLSHHDFLTGLSNRHFFTQYLEFSLNNAKRDHSKMALLFINLDNFKHINDTQGHDVGDQLLISVSKRLKDLLRSTDTLSRIGGDEFMILIENIDNLNTIKNITQKILALFKRPFYLPNYELNTSCSIGITLYPQDGDDSSTLIKNADLALYQAKDLGRNCYRFFHE